MSQVWSDVTTLEAALKVFKDQSPVLATRTDACLTEAILDTLADMQDMEDGKHCITLRISCTVLHRVCYVMRPYWADM